MREIAEMQYQLGVALTRHGQFDPGGTSPSVDQYQLKVALAQSQPTQAQINWTQRSFCAVETVFGRKSRGECKLKRKHEGTCRTWANMCWFRSTEYGIQFDRRQCAASICIF